MNYLYKLSISIGVVILLALLTTPPRIFSEQGSQALNRISEIRLEDGEAAVWYLYHAGWAVKTAGTLMIFDYVPDGFLDPNSIKDQNVIIFITHGHGDHYDRKILDWETLIPNITYVFGWQTPEAQGHLAFGKDRTTHSIGPMKVINIFHDFDNIPESAFLIEVDGLSIYFSGDHGGWAGDLNPVYMDNIDYLSQKSIATDLAFLSIFGSPTYDAEFYAIQKFKPHVMMPMHLGGNESDAEDVIRLGQSKFPKTEFWYPLKQGDGFLYQNGKISIEISQSRRAFPLQYP